MGRKLYNNEPETGRLRLISGPITSWQIDQETMETGQTLFSWAPKSLQIVATAMKLKDTRFLEENL